jgi:hypothetical protein
VEITALDQRKEFHILVKKYFTAESMKENLYILEDLWRLPFSKAQF